MLQAYSSGVRTIEEQVIRVKMTINASISLGTPLFTSVGLCKCSRRTVAESEQ